MATGGGPQKQGDDNGGKKPIAGFAAGLTFTGGALVGAALLYGAKKLYDYIQAEKAQSTEEEECAKQKLYANDGPSECADYSSPEHGEPYASVSSAEQSLVSGLKTNKEDAVKSDRSRDRKADENLHDLLVNFHSSVASIPCPVMDATLKITKDMELAFMECLEEFLPRHPLRGLKICDSKTLVFDNTDEVVINVTVCLSLDASQWELVDAGNTLMKAPGYYLVKRTNTSFFSIGSGPYDRYLVGEYFSPQRIKTAFQDMTNRVGEWSSNHKVLPAVFGSEVYLDVKPSSGRSVKIYFIPEISIGETSVLAVPHPLQRQEASLCNVWQENFEDKLMEKLLVDTDAGQNSCHIMCLDILHSVQEQHEHDIGLLGASFFSMVVLHLLDQEDEWSEKAISERFIDILIASAEYLSSGVCPNYFNNKHNILQYLPGDLLRHNASILEETVNRGNFQMLLRG